MHRYVEFGCGLGSVARWAATQAAHVTATDLSEEQLTEARRVAGDDRRQLIRPASDRVSKEAASAWVQYDA